MDLRDQYVEKANGDTWTAAVMLGWDLMQDDPAQHHVGYTPANAAIAAAEYVLWRTATSDERKQLQRELETKLAASRA